MKDLTLIVEERVKAFLEGKGGTEEKRWPNEVNVQQLSDLRTQIEKEYEIKKVEPRLRPAARDQIYQAITHQFNVWDISRENILFTGKQKVQAKLL